MNDKIKFEIENNNLNYAKAEILKLEESLITEKSDYSRCKTLEKINKYKALYSQKIQFKDKNLEKLDTHLQTEFETFKSTESLIYEGICNETVISNLLFTTGKISNCKSSTFNFFDIKESLVIENCEDCVIICKAKQLRLKNSKKLTFKVFIEAGTSLENCQEISFTNLEENQVSNNELKNNYKNVKDFTTPFGSKNYSFCN